jgi:hypothetical protein
LEDLDAILVAIDPSQFALAAAEGPALGAELIERLSGCDQALFALARSLALECAGGYPNGPQQKARFNAIAPADDAAARKDQGDLAKFCDEKSPGVTDLPIDRIGQAVQPTPAQRAALDELKDASVKAAEGLKVSCPAYQMLTPTGRVEAMGKQLDATLGAVKTVQPALAKFYDGLSDEQKARFNSLRADAVRTYPPPGPVVVDQGHSRTGERGNSVSSSRNVTPPQYLDEE